MIVDALNNGMSSFKFKNYIVKIVFVKLSCMSYIIFKEILFVVMFYYIYVYLNLFVKIHLNMTKNKHVNLTKKFTYRIILKKLYPL